MIDIYDEVGYIKNILQSGLSQKEWKRDLILLIRYYKLEGNKKAEAKLKAKEKCERYVIGWNKNVHYATFNNIFEKAWKKEDPLRQIKQIEFSKEVLDWFLNLSETSLTQEELDSLKSRRSNVKITKKPMNIRRIQFLFTIFVWVKVQENYLEKPDRIYWTGKDRKRFKQDACLTTSFSLKNERNLLYDMGYIDINRGLGIIPKFMDNDVFKIPITDKNRILLSGDDLYNCGNWIKSQRYPHYRCENCGKLVIYKPNKDGGRPPKYCKECAKVIGKKKIFKKGENLRKIRCSKCGKEIEINKFTNTGFVLCRECYYGNKQNE